MAVFDEYAAVGIKEDISDIIVNISPTKTPFQSMLGSEKVTQKLFQWQEDSLRAVASNAQPEGFTASSITVNPTVLRSNVTQILAETVAVSGTMDVVSTYGRAKESAYQMAKSAAQVKRDLENAMVGISQAAVVGSTGVARQMASYPQLLTAAGNAVFMGAATVLTEASLLTSLQNCYNAGAEPDTVSVTPNNALTIAGFAKAGAQRSRMINDNGANNTRVVNAVDVYMSPFGEVKVILNRFQKNLTPPTGIAYTLVYDSSMWLKATLRPWFRQALAITGDNTPQMIVGEFSLKHKNFLASSIVVDNSTATNF
jgi:hypothetical protein